MMIIEQRERNRTAKLNQQWLDLRQRKGIVISANVKDIWWEIENLKQNGNPGFSETPKGPAQIPKSKCISKAVEEKWFRLSLHKSINLCRKNRVRTAKKNFDRKYERHIYFILYLKVRHALGFSQAIFQYHPRKLPLQLQRNFSWCWCASFGLMAGSNNTCSSFRRPDYYVLPPIYHFPMSLCPPWALEDAGPHPPLLNRQHLFVGFYPFSFHSFLDRLRD